jgi:hypothetical protein
MITFEWFPPSAYGGWRRWILSWWRYKYTRGIVVCGLEIREHDPRGV